MTRLFMIAILAMPAALTTASAQSVSLFERDSRVADCLKSDPNAAIKGCTLAIELHSDPPGNLTIYYFLRGNAFYAKGEFDRAIEDYSEAIERSPQFNRAYNNRGNAFAAKHDYDHAIEDFSEAIGIQQGYVAGDTNPRPFDRATVFQNRGIALFHKSYYSRAILDFNEAIRIKPNDPDAFYNRGITYNTMGDFGSAIADYNESIRLNANNAFALYSRGISKRNSDDVEGAGVDLAAALKIDPEIAAKVGEMRIPVTPIAAFKETAQLKSQSVPTCDALQAGAPAVARNQSYVDEPIEQLKKIVPALSGIKLEAGEKGAGSPGAGTAEDKTASILRQTGAAVADMLHRMPNLIAREEVRRPDGVFQLGGVAALNRGLLSSGGMSASNVARYKVSVFSYRIVPKTKLDGGDALDEFRTDEHDHSVDDSARNPDKPQSVGYATTWLFFFPGNFQESAFRYLGQQKIGNRETYVLAFAQVPDKTVLNTVVDSGYGRCSTSIQGVAWVDESTFGIVRMQTDLLSPQPAIKLNQLRSVINYSEVKIPERSLLLWLPKDVEVAWQSTDRAGAEFHTYSKYRLFGSTVTILPADETPSH